MSFLNGLLGFLPAVGQGLTEYMASETAKRNTDKTIEANKQLAQYQYSKDVEMWNRGNEYNNPTSQMARLKTAGLNPNLVYGSGVTGNTTTQLPKYQAPRVEYNYRPMDFGGILSFYQDIKLKQAQYDNLKAQRDAIVNTGRLKGLEADLFNDTYFPRASMLRDKAGLLRQRKDWMYEHGGELFNTQLQGLEVSNRRAEQMIKTLESQSRLNQERTDWYMWEALGKIGGNITNMFRGMMPSINPKYRKK